MQAHESGDLPTAIREYKLAAESGDLRAQLQLGLMYMDGDDVPQNYDEAVRWFREMAENGFAGGQYLLARMYLRGDVVDCDRLSLSTQIDIQDLPRRDH